MVFKREYKSHKTHKSVWAYQFQWRNQTYKKSGYLTQGEAEKAEGDKLKKLKDEERRTVPVQRAVLREFAPLFLVHRQTTNVESTAVREERRLRPFLELHGGKKLDDITVADIHAYVAKRKRDDHLSNRSINLELNTLRCLFRYAEDLGCCAETPMRKVRNLRETVKIDHWIPTPEELNVFVSEAAKTYSGPVLAAWVWTMAYTGMRPSEALFLEWEDVDFDSERIIIKPKPGNPLKTGKARYVEIHAELKPRLLEWREVWEEKFKIRARRHRDEPAQPHQWVFYNPHGQKDRAISFLRCFAKAKENSGLPKMTPYTLRHFFISYCVMSGIPTLTIARWVGHASSKMIEQVYGHLTPDYRVEQMTRFRIFKSAEKAAEPQAGAVQAEQST